MRIRKTIFGRSKIKPNTFIGGVSATLNTPSLVASKLGISVSRIKAFNITGSDIEFAVIGNYIIRHSCFLNDKSITYYRDETGLVTGIEGRAFRSCISLMLIKTDNALFCGDESITNTKVTELIFPNMQSFTGAYGSFRLNPELKKVDCPKVTSSSWSYSGIDVCPKLELVNLPKLSLLRSGVNANNSNYIFYLSKVGFTLNVSSAALTSNSGNLDRDVSFAITNRGAVVNYLS
ncbi:hypothetical protein [Flavobacterium sp. RS13.1]|uniref:hypothetical protein n=1 Tax=Flavobacterium sp. RS13.1 TaxID=3400345 RepID=UPI003AAF8A6C